MNVLIEGYIAFVSRGGISNYVYNLIKGFQKLKINNKIIVFSHPLRLKEIKNEVTKYSNCKVVPFPLRALIGFSGSLALPRLEIFEKFGDIYHATYGIALPSNKKIVLTIHDLTFIKYPQFVKPSIRRFFLTGIKNSIKFADAIIVPSEATKKDLIKFYNYPEERIYKIYMDSQFYQVNEEKSILSKFSLIKRKYFLFIGQIERRKNIINILRGFKIFIKNNKIFKLVIAGSIGWDKEYYMEVINYIKNNNIPNIIFTGKVEKNELYTLLKYSKALLLISHYEGFGIPVVEAMKEGIPIIISRRGALPEIAADAGIYVDKDCPSDISDKMKLLTEDERMWELYSKKGKNRSKFFSWDITVKKTIEVYKKVME